MTKVEDSKNKQGSVAVILIIGVFAISSSAIFIRLAQDEQVPSLVIAAWRTLIAALVLLPFALLQRRTELSRLTRGEWALAVLSGVMLGLHFAAWISSLALTSITSSTVFVATVPLWVALASPFLLGESLSRGLKIGIGLAFVGAVVIGLSDVLMLDNGRIVFNLRPTANASNPLLGNLLALTGAIAAATYMIIGRRLRQGLSLLSYTTVVYGMAAVTLVTATIIAGQSMFGFSPQVFLLFLAMALIPQLIGHTSFNWALSFLPAAFVSIAAISEPVGASILAILFFQEFPGPAAIVGAILILAGVVMASRRPTS